MRGRIGRKGTTGWTGAIGRLLPVLAVLPFLSVGVALAQSPNTSSLVVTVIDQSGAALPGAQIDVTNTATGDVRHAVSGGNGASTIPALGLTGSYRVAVSLTGFKSAEVHDIVLRAGETAAARVMLAVAIEPGDVTVYGTTAGVRAGRYSSPSLPTPWLAVPICGTSPGC